MGQHGAEIDRAFVSRRWIYLWIDAAYLKVGQNSRSLPVAVIVAVGVNTDGRWAALGMHIGPFEGRHVLDGLLRDSHGRGL